MISGQTQKKYKRDAASFALRYLHSNIILGLGSGSTMAIFTDLLAEQLKSGRLENIRAVPTSEDTAEQARQLGIPMIGLSQLYAERDEPLLDLAVDGADEVDDQLNLIKGLGRALLREKIVEIHADQFVVIVDETKRVKQLGAHVPLPVEILPFEHGAHLAWLRTLCQRVELVLEADGKPVATDNGNYLAHCWFEGGISDLHLLDRQLSSRPGILEHGLFLDMATCAVVAGSQGVQVLERAR